MINFCHNNRIEFDDAAGCIDVIIVQKWIGTLNIFEVSLEARTKTYPNPPWMSVKVCKSEISGQFSSIFSRWFWWRPGAVQTWPRLPAFRRWAGGLRESFSLLCANIATWFLSWFSSPKHHDHQHQSSTITIIIFNHQHWPSSLIDNIINNQY